MKIKNILKQRLPKPIVQAIKKVRYTKKIRALTDQSNNDFRGIGHLIDKGDIVVDIGANMGFYTKFLAEKVGQQGAVYSIEPIPDSFQILSHVKSKLNLINVSLLNYAISDANETVTMEIPIQTSGEENLYEAKITESSTDATHVRTVTVETRTIDSLFLQPGKKVSFVKCDVEGHELRCLKGAVSFIKQCNPAWLIEIWGDLDDTQSAGLTTVNFLKQFGYELYVFDGTQFRPKNPGEKDINYFFLAESHVQRLRNQKLLHVKNVNHAN